MYSASNQWIINSKLIRTNSVQIFYRYNQNLIQFALSYRKTDLVVIQDKVKSSMNNHGPNSIQWDLSFTFFSIKNIF